jgi:hypothetical protein
MLVASRNGSVEVENGWRLVEDEGVGMEALTSRFVEDEGFKDEDYSRLIVSTLKIGGRRRLINIECWWWLQVWKLKGLRYWKLFEVDVVEEPEEFFCGQ